MRKIFWGLACLPLTGLALLLMPLTARADGPVIHSVTTNAAAYPNSQIPRYQKFEITFQVDTAAQNLQLPFDFAPPPGITPEIGVSVDALFTPDNWQTIYRQPAFYYQEFQDEVKGGQEWFYPSGNFAWKARFAPHQAGSWQFRLAAQDAGGLSQTQPFSFTVAPSTNRGFIRVSRSDPRYFEFDDGSYFPALGYNMNYNQIDWINPVLSNETNFQKMSQNGIQLVRMWLSQWGIYGPSWNPWNAIDPKLHGQSIPNPALSFEQAYPGSQISMQVSAAWNRCMFIGAWKAKPAVKPNTTYRVRIRYKTAGIDGPKVAGQPYGFVAKTGGWLNNCDQPDAGTAVTPHQPQNTADWQILEGSLTTGGSDFLPNFYLVMDNANQGVAYVDYVWLEENLGNGSYGPNIVPKPWMAHHLYMEQRNSYAFDKVVQLAEQYGVYLRPVIHEKNEWIFNRIDDAGNFTSQAGNDNFYGNGREVTKVRWLQQAWWRYLQARWGYSTGIHSWELLNEGDPNNDRHYALADELGKFMHCRVFGVAVGNEAGDRCLYEHPNAHPVSTSNWHSFPKDKFWASPNYPNVDFADVHQYIDQADPLFADAALMTASASLKYGRAGKPVIRGETGFGDGDSPVKNDVEGIWLRNYIWGGINPGGLIESYWYANRHIYFGNIDHRPIYRTYYNFIRDIPLNNGHYADAQAAASNENLRAWGQKDVVNGRAHLWLQNKHHTWQHVVDGLPIPAITATVTITGFTPNQNYALEWWDTYQPDPARQRIQTETLTAGPDGALLIVVNNLGADIALKIFPPARAGSIPSLAADYLGRSPEEMCASPVKIMPLGNSITRGISAGVDDPSRQVGYRRDLWERLIAAGYNVDFVGGLKHGQAYPNFDPDHEGHSGSWPKHLNVTRYLNRQPADIILLHIGTNGLNQANPNEITRILDNIDAYEQEHGVAITVILARIINRLNGNSAATTTLNNAVEEIARQRIAAGDRLIIVDMERAAGLNYAQFPTGDMSDWAHPAASGYAKMAAVWFDALATILPVCGR